MAEVKVRLAERSYSVHVGSGILRQAGPLIESAGLADYPRFIITDENVAASQSSVLELLADRASTLAVVPPGEESKSIAMFSHLVDQLAKFEPARGAVVAAVGGGMVGDLSGFVAACYKRGIPFIQVPTTLLAQVDSSIGGKCAVNHATAKNLIGAFHQPRLVIADISVLSTLPDRELRSGLAEVIKHGVIEDEAFFGRVEAGIEGALQREISILEDMVTTSCVIKSSVVQADERDTGGRRAILNYGHTFGHAIELASDFRLAHGEAISLGMCCAGDLSVRMGLLSSDHAHRIEAVLKRAGLPTAGKDAVASGIPLSSSRVLECMRSDKKFSRGENCFVVLKKIGMTELMKGVPDSLIAEILSRRLHE